MADASSTDGGAHDSGPRPGDALIVGDAPSETDAGGAALCGATEVPCTDQSVARLRLFDTVNPAAVTEEGTTAGEFRTLVDARAGGSMSTQSFVYLRFTDAGLAKVEVSDEGAFTSMDWDLAVRRYVIRLNSGVGGPSCVQAARAAPGTTFEALTAAPTNVAWRTEGYFTDSCELVNDGSGIGAPGTALSSFWSYRSCVQMTGNVFAIRLRSGRHVKLQVLSYYSPTAQAACDSTGMVPSPNDAGMVRLRWAFIDG